MENYDKYYSQFKNYLFSNIKILNILNSDNKEDYNNDWRNDIFYAISSDFINFSHFKNILRQLPPT